MPQVQYHWGNLERIFSSAFHSGPELESQRDAHVEATDVLRSCMSRFHTSNNVEQVRPWRCTTPAPLCLRPCIC